jgi:hypothetical protein
MSDRLFPLRRLTITVAITLTGCTTSPQPSAPALTPSDLPPLPVEQVSDRSVARQTDPHAVEDPLARLPLGEPVSLRATAVEVPVLLAALGEAAGISLVVDSSIEGRISVNFVDVPAREALRVVLAEAGLFIAAGPPRAPYGPVVFYTVPIDIDEAGVELIQMRFGVSRQVAEFIVRSRVR